MKYNIAYSFFKTTNLPWLHNNTIFLCIHGSNAYGTNTPESDLDIRGIAIPPKEYFLLFNKNFEQAQFKNNDITIFGISKFFTLAIQGNPNVLELLFVDDDEVLSCSSKGRLLVENRDLFLSKKIKYTMEGYAYSQLKRIRTHRSWLLNPIDKEPKRSDYGLPDHTIIPKDQLLAVESLIQKKLDQWNLGFDDLEPAVVEKIKNDVSDLMIELCGASIYINNEALWKRACASLGLDSNFIELIQKEKKYKSRRTEWQQYNLWKTTRNPKRAELEAKYGYDLKHAMHLYRLYSQCEEILKTGTLTLKNEDRIKIMLKIRNGEWSFDKLIGFVDDKSKEMNEIYEASELRYSPNLKKVEELFMEIIDG